jgi:hypothetical protein
MRGKIVSALIPIALAAACGSSSGSPSGGSIATPAENAAGDSLGVPSASAADVPNETTATPDAKVAVTAWAQGGGLAKITGITTALGKIAVAGTAGDVTALKPACIDLAVAVSAAKDYGAIPESTIQGHWAAGLAKLNDAAVHCSAGLLTNNAALLSQCADEETAGGAELSEANKELLAL